MKAGIWTNFLHGMSFEEKVPLYKQCGINYGELSDEDAFTLLERGSGKNVGSKLRKFIDSQDFALPQGHLWLKVNVSDDNYKENVETLKNWLDMFLELGIRSAVLHPGFIEGNIDIFTGFDRMIWSYSQLAEYVKDCDIDICIENMSAEKLKRSDGSSQVESLIALIKKVNSPKMGLTLDTGHLNLMGGGHYDYIKKAGSLLKAMHIDDNKNVGIDEHLTPYGNGTVPWHEVMKALKEIGYDRFLSFELPGESQRLPIEIAMIKLKYISGIMDYMLKM